MTCCCNSNPAQYERNRRFRHLVHVLGWKANGAKLPSEGLWLNASKSESRLVMATIILLPKVGRRVYARSDRCIKCPWKWPCWMAEAPSSCQNETIHVQCWGAKSFADDLVTGQGVVFSRAASTLRSVETQPLTGWFVLPHYTSGTGSVVGIIWHQGSERISMALSLGLEVASLRVEGLHAKCSWNERGTLHKITCPSPSERITRKIGEAFQISDFFYICIKRWFVVCMQIQITYTNFIFHMQIWFCM